MSHEHLLERETEYDNDGKARDRYGSLGDGPAKDFDGLSLGNGSTDVRYTSGSVLREEEGERARDGGAIERGGSGGGHQRMDVDT